MNVLLGMGVEVLIVVTVEMVVGAEFSVMSPTVTPSLSTAQTCTERRCQGDVCAYKRSGVGTHIQIQSQNTACLSERG